MHTPRLALALALLLPACGDDAAADAAGAPDAAALAPDAANAADAARAPDVADAANTADAPAPDALPPGPACDDSQPPVVVVHGFLASGDTYSAHVRRFAANGECADRFHAFDWNTLDRQHDHATDLDALIDAVRAQHGAAQVDLMGHSAGGGLGYTYLADAARAAKVRRYVHIASPPAEAAAGPPDGTPVPTLNLRSTADTVVEGGDIPGAENVTLTAEDHYAVATSAASFSAIYGFLRGGATPATDDPTGASGADGTVEISGRVLVLGDNTPDEGSEIRIFALDAATGARLDDTPEATYTVGSEARFGPFSADTSVRYEFLVTSPRAGARPVRYFHRPFVTDDALLYLRTLPTSGLPGALLGQIPFDDSHSVVVVYSARGALLAGRDSLMLDGEEVATDAIAAPEDTTIALFVYDEMGDGQNGGSTAAFEAFPFLAGLDRFLAPEPARPLPIALNGVELPIPRRPSGTEGASIVVFDSELDLR